MAEETNDELKAASIEMLRDTFAKLDIMYPEKREFHKVLVTAVYQLVSEAYDEGFKSALLTLKT